MLMDNPCPVLSSNMHRDHKIWLSLCRYLFSLTCWIHQVPVKCGTQEMIAEPVTSAACRAHSSFCSGDTIQFLSPHHLTATLLSSSSSSGASSSSPGSASVSITWRDSNFGMFQWCINSLWKGCSCTKKYFTFFISSFFVVHRLENSRESAGSEGDILEWLSHFWISHQRRKLLHCSRESGGGQTIWNSFLSKRSQYCSTSWSESLQVWELILKIQIWWAKLKPELFYLEILV